MEIDSRYVSPMLMWALALSGAVLIGFFTPPIAVFAKGPLTDMAAALLFLNWVGFYLLGLWQNREAESSVANLKKLHTSGLYSLARHPLYFSDMGLTTAMFLYMTTLNFMLPAVYIIAVLYLWSGLEEDALLKKFGKKYADYQKRVPRFIPLPPWA